MKFTYNFNIKNLSLFYIRSKFSITPTLMANLHLEFQHKAPSSPKIGTYKEWIKQRLIRLVMSYKTKNGNKRLKGLNKGIIIRVGLFG
jgi:hypothetical protein